MKSHDSLGLWRQSSTGDVGIIFDIGCIRIQLWTHLHHSLTNFPLAKTIDEIVTSTDVNKIKEMLKEIEKQKSEEKIDNDYV